MENRSSTARKLDENTERIQKTSPSHSSASIISYKPSSISGGMVVKYIFLTILFAVSLFFQIYANAENTEIQSKINECNVELKELRSENTRMKAEIESKSGMKDVEAYAVNVLGMQKLEKSQCEYISLTTENVIEIPEEEDNIFVVIKNKWDDLVDGLRG